MNDYNDSDFSSPTSEPQPAAAPPPQQPAPIIIERTVEQSRGRGLSFWLALTCAVLLAGSVLFNLIFVVIIGGMAASGSVEGMPDMGLPEKVYEGSGFADKKIALIHINGVISSQSEDGMFGELPSMVDRAQKRIRQATKDESVVALVLAINTPGGGVTASDVLYNDVATFHATGRPVIVHMGDLCASGGYYIAAAADELIASPTTITGSIGVIMSMMNAEGLLVEKLGLEFTPITSGKHKDIASPTRSMTAEERTILQNIVNDMYSRFVDLVVAGRQGHGPFTGEESATRATITALADGRIYTGTQALENGLVDKVGYLEDALQSARERSGAEDADVITYTQVQGLGALFGAQQPIEKPVAALQTALSPKLEYRWHPTAQ